MAETSLIVKLDGRQAAQAAQRLERDLKGLEGQGHKSAKQMDELSGAAKSVRVAMAGLKGLIAGIGLQQLFQLLVGLTDRWKSFSARVAGSTDSIYQFNRSQKELLRLAKDNGVEIQSTIKLFQDLKRVSGELGASNDQILELTDLVQKLGVVGGSTTDQMRNGLLQFSQGLASGTFRAEEMNSVLENMPEVAAAIARGMKEINPEFEGGIGALRTMVREGKLLSDEVFRALMSQSEEIAQQFENMPVTFSRAMNTARVELFRIIGQFDELAGTSAELGESVGGIVSRLENISTQDLREFISDLSYVVEWLAYVNIGLQAAAKALAASAAVSTIALRDLTAPRAEVNQRNQHLVLQRRISSAETALANPELDPKYVPKLTEDLKRYREELDALGTPPDMTTVSDVLQRFSDDLVELGAESEATAERFEKFRQGVGKATINEEAITNAEHLIQLHRDQAVELQQLANAYDHFAERAGNEELSERSRTYAREMTRQLQGYIAEVDKAAGSTYEMDAAASKLLETIETESRVLDDYASDMRQLSTELGRAIEAGADEQQITALRQAMSKLTDDTREKLETMRDDTAEAKKADTTYENLVKSLKGQITATQLSGRELFIHNQLLKSGIDLTGDLTEEEKERVANLKEISGRLYDVSEAERQAELRANAFAEAWGQALARIDSSFVNMWRNIGDGFSDFADNLKNAFLDLLAELAHAAITRPIVLSMTAGLGLGGAGAANAGGGFINALSNANAAGGGGTGFGGLLATGAGLLKSGFTALNNSLFNAAFSVTRGIDAIGLPGVANFLDSSIASLGSAPGQLAGGIGLSVLGGIGGNFLNRQLFGQSGGIGSTVGGIGGSLFGASLGALGWAGGPIGALVGTVIGGAIDSIFGGDGKKRSNIGVLQGTGLDRFDPDRLTNITTAASGLEIGAFARRGDERAAREFQQTLLTLDQSLTQLASALGAEIDLSSATLSGTVADAGRSGPGQFFGLKGFNGTEGDLRDSVANFVRAWLQETESQFDANFQPVIGRIVDQFGDSAEDMVNALEAATNVRNAFEDLRSMLTAVSDAAEDFNGQWMQVQQVYERSTMTLMELWRDQGREIITLARDVEDAADFAVLTNAIYERYQVELRLLGQVAAALDAVGNTFTRTREQIELAQRRVQDPTGVAEYDFFRARADELAGQIGESSDPAAIMSALQEIDSAARSAFGLLSDQEKLSVGNEILAFLDEVETLAEERLGSTLDEIERSREGELGDVISGAINDVNSVMLTEIERVFGEMVTAQRDVAAANSNSTTRFSNAVDRFSSAPNARLRFSNSEIV